MSSSCFFRSISPHKFPDLYFIASQSLEKEKLYVYTMLYDVLRRLKILNNKNVAIRKKYILSIDFKLVAWRLNFKNGKI